MSTIYYSQQYFHFIFLLYPQAIMRKVLAQASVGDQHKELVLKDLKSIFKRIKISLEILLQEEISNSDQKEPLMNGSLFRSYPYITLTIPNYQQHREYLQKVYKNNVLFSKFILLISKGDTYEQLLSNRNQQILREQCRNWNSTVSCSFNSTPTFTDIAEQLNKIDNVLGGMDIRGKITDIDAQKKFHLIEDHHKDLVDNLPVYPVKISKKSLKKLFFGVELVECRGRRCLGAGGARGIILGSLNKFEESEQFLEYQEQTTYETSYDSDWMNMNHDPDMINQKPQQNNSTSSSSNKKPSSKKEHASRRLTKRRPQIPLVLTVSTNPYLKKQYIDYVSISGQGEMSLQ